MSQINYIHCNVIHNKTAACEVLPFLFSLLNPRTVIDVGCGTGSWLAVSKELGAANILGIDGIYPEEHLFCIEKDEFRQHDLTLPLQLNITYDLAICLEVAEHLPPSAANNLVKILTDHSDMILFSAAVPGQGGQNHINEQWPDYWQEKFSERGYFLFDLLRDRFWDNEKVDWWYKQNMFVYSKPEGNQLLQAKSIRKKIHSRIHPELFQLQVELNEIQTQIIKKRIWNPELLPTIRLLFKSIVKSFL